MMHHNATSAKIAERDVSDVDIPSVPLELVEVPSIPGHMIYDQQFADCLY